MGTAEGNGNGESREETYTISQIGQFVLDYIDYDVFARNFVESFPQNYKYFCETDRYYDSGHHHKHWLAPQIDHHIREVFGPDIEDLFNDLLFMYYEELEARVNERVKYYRSLEPSPNISS